MIGLAEDGARLYHQIVTLCAARSLPPRKEDIRAFIYGERLRHRLNQLELRGFISIDRFSRITALEPPHIVVMREVCMTTGYSEDDIRSKSHSVVLVRARRIIAKRLRYKFRYPIAQIAIVINRNKSSVEDYFNPERTQQRSKRRAAMFYSRVAAQRSEGVPA